MSNFLDDLLKNAGGTIFDQGSGGGPTGLSGPFPNAAQQQPTQSPMGMPQQGAPQQGQEGGIWDKLMGGVSSVASNPMAQYLAAMGLARALGFKKNPMALTPIVGAMRTEAARREQEEQDLAQWQQEQQGIQKRFETTTDLNRQRNKTDEEQLNLLKVKEERIAKKEAIDQATTDVTDALWGSIQSGEQADFDAIVSATAKQYGLDEGVAKGIGVRVAAEISRRDTERTAAQYSLETAQANRLSDVFSGYAINLQKVKDPVRKAQMRDRARTDALKLAPNMTDFEIDSRLLAAEDAALKGEVDLDRIRATTASARQSTEYSKVSQARAGILEAGPGTEFRDVNDPNRVLGKVEDPTQELQIIRAQMNISKDDNALIESAMRQAGKVLGKANTEALEPAEFARSVAEILEKSMKRPDLAEKWRNLDYTQVGTSWWDSFWSRKGVVEVGGGQEVQWGRDEQGNPVPIG